MKHTETYYLRWYETNAARELRPSALLALMQETANLQFERANRSLDVLRDREGLAFILSRLALDMPVPLHAYDTVTVETFTCPSHGAGFMRGFCVRRGDETVARGASQWALVNLATRRLTPVSAAPFSFEDEPPAVTEMPLRFAAPANATFEAVGTRTVAYEDIDYNMHMNNARYPDMVCDFLPDPAAVRVTGISLSYLKEAPYGGVLAVERADLGGGRYQFSAKNDANLCLEALVKTEPR